MIGTDKNILNENSESRQRILEYGKLVEKLHIIALTARNFQNEDKIQKVQIADNVFVYPTNSKNKLSCIFDAIKIGKIIIENCKLSASWRIGNFPMLISCQDPFECGLAGYLLKRKFKIPLHLQIHTDFLSPYFRREFLKNRVRVWLAKFLIPRADCVRAVSKRIEKSILEKISAKVKIKVLPVFVDVKKIQEAPIKTDLHKKYPQFDFIVLMASRLTKEKNIGLAISAFAGIAKKYSKIGLVIVGDGPLKNNLKSQILSCLQRDKSGQNIILEDWADDLNSYYKTADLFLLTSNYEGYGRTVVEALSVECPVVMTDVGLAGDILKDGQNGLIAPVNNRTALQRAMERMINDSALRAKIRNSSQDISAKVLNKEQYLNEYKQIWEDCFLS